MKVLWISIACLALSLPEAQARLDRIPGSRYTSARAAALGDAFLPLGEDVASALFVNPANIAALKSAQFEPMNLQFQLNQEYIDMFSLNFFKATSLSSYQGTLAQNPAKQPGVGFQYVPSFGFRGFAFGLLLSTQFSARQYDSTSLFYRSKYQIIPALGLGIPLARGIVRLGYSLQWVNLSQGERTVNPSVDTVGYNEGIQSGSAFSHNLGFALIFPVEALPSVHLVARNVLGANYGSGNLYSFAKNPSGKPSSESMSVDASVSLHPKTGKGGQVNLVAQLRDLTSTSGYSLIKRLALGIEYDFRNVFFLRGGYGSQYPSAGIGFRSQKADFHLTWYSEEIGSAGIPKRDIRMLMQYQMRVF
jgi:hypothetical protein